MIGDNYSTDIVGAMQLGMSTVWLTDVSIAEKQSELPKPTEIFSDLQAFFDGCLAPPGFCRNLFINVK
jgi:FMN phosphatase YigB (HAD superfamily)